MKTELFKALPVIAIALAVASCYAETAGTALTFETAALGVIDSGQVAPDAAFTNAKGWTITLDKAIVALGPVYYYSSEPQASLFQRIMGFTNAYACPAHAQFDKGTVLGEIRRQYAIDLMSTTPTTMGTSVGVEGQCRMFEVHFHPPGDIPAGSDETAFAGLGADSFMIAGTAQKDDKLVAFSASMTIPDEGTMRIVESIPADVALYGDPGTAVTRIHLDMWLANVDFDSIIDETEACLIDGDNGACEIGPDSQAHAAWLTGVRSRASYTLDWIDG